jgi:hypothetical protein
MLIGILGTGGVARTLAGTLSERGHEVVIGSRDPEAALARDEVNHQTGTTLAGWHEANPAVRIGRFTDAASHGEPVINATSGTGSLAAIAAAGTDHLDGTILIDAANPLEPSEQGMRLSVANTDSLAEQIQRAVPGARVVKALNTVTAPLMVNPGSLHDGDHTLPICGNDDGAKRDVARWLGEWFGWRDVLDLGDLSAARGMEAYLLLWLRFMQATGTPTFNTKIVR